MEGQRKSRGEERFGRKEEGTQRQGEEQVVGLKKDGGGGGRVIHEGLISCIVPQVLYLETGSFIGQNFDT